MKKALALVLTLTLLLGGTCMARGKAESPAPRILVAYFSLCHHAESNENVDATTSASVVREDERLLGTTEVIEEQILQTLGGDRPNLTMEVIPMGRMTSDLAPFIQLDGDVEVPFALVE